MIPYRIIILRFMLESCIEIGLSAMICLLSIDSKTLSTVDEASSTIFAMISLVILLIAPFYMLKISKQYLIDMDEHKEVPKEEPSPYSRIFEDYKVNKQAVRYSVLFFTRRYSVLLVMILVPMNKMT